VLQRAGVGSRADQQGVIQVSQVVQSNAGDFRGKRRRKEELSSQAAQLREKISVFKVKQGQTKPGTDFGCQGSNSKYSQCAEIGL
jgi:hypothetical protein